MAHNIAALAAGLLFGLGLVISGMINPQKVLGFLNFAGDWDGSLALVMAGALLTLGTLQRFILRRPTPLLGEKFYLPTAKIIDAPLLVGAMLFGLGWGLAGLCPGPAMAGLSLGITENTVFVIAMLAGMWFFQVFHNKK
jgi:uncharacterized membrane protein YedE/YeeE